MPYNGRPACISNAQGELLFYTNGGTVYGKDRLPMPNGRLLDGNEGKFYRNPASSVIVPKGGTEYYLFSLLPDSFVVNRPQAAPDTLVHPSLYYSVIDMVLNGGNGDIVPGSRKVLMKSGLMRGFLVAAAGPGCDSTWIAVHEQEANTFLCYPVTASGIGAPVASTTGVNYLSDSQPGSGFYYGKLSPDSRRMALLSSRHSIAIPIDPGTFASLELLDFDRTSGVFFNALSLFENQDFSPFMLGFFPMSFSPDAKKLYTVQRTLYNAAEWNAVVQYNLSAPSLADIIASETVIGTIPPQSPGNAPFITDMRLGPDQKVYVACADNFGLFTGSIPIARILHPDVSGMACSFENGQASGLMRPGFPLLFPSGTAEHREVSASAQTQRLCAGGPLTIGASRSGSYLWSNGSTDSSITVTASGSYWVHITDVCSQHTDTFTLLPPVNPDLLPGDTTICPGEHLAITLPAYPDVRYTWPDGSSGNSYIADRNGILKVFAATSCGRIEDSMHIAYRRCDCDYLFVPNAFSPNADGHNDVFLPRFPCDRTAFFYELRIYNRWGQEIFITRDPGQGWNGLSGGQYAETGVYHYTVSVSADRSGKALFKKGQLTLLR